MRSTTIGLMSTAALALAGCGSGAHFANAHRPPTAVDLTVYVNDSSVSVSPASVGAGPVIFLVTNQASKTVSLTIRSSGGQSLATTGPINPGAPAQLTVDFTAPGAYSIATSTTGTQASLATGKAIKPATLHIGASRASADNSLLQP